MSPKRRKIRYTPAAVSDIEEVLASTGEPWDSTQRGAYKRLLMSSTRGLANQQYLGKAREEFRPGLRSVPVHLYRVYYSVSDTEVHNWRILHQRRDEDSISWIED